MNILYYKDFLIDNLSEANLDIEIADLEEQISICEEEFLLNERRDAIISFSKKGIELSKAGKLGVKFGGKIIKGAALLTLKILKLAITLLERLLGKKKKMKAAGKDTSKIDGRIENTQDKISNLKSKLK